MEELVEKCKMFKAQPSLFDGMFRKSWISTTPYKGLYNLLIFLGTIGIGVDVGVNLYDKGYAVNYELILKMGETIGWLALYSFSIGLYSLTAFGLQVLLLKGYSRTLGITLQHITQSVMFVYSMMVVYFTQWIHSHHLFIGFFLCVMFFKMHSYTSSNMEMHLSKKRPASFPANLTLSNFIHYLFVPTFVYKPEYPRSSTPISIFYIISKVCVGLLLMLKIYLIATDYVLPAMIQYKDDGKFVLMYVKLVIPVAIIILISLYITFDCICNLLAEITGFVDRKFYDDFWNSTSIDQFFKKLNVLIPSFLRIYCYAPLVKMGIPLRIAKYITLILSFLMLEMIMLFFFRMPRIYIFLALLIGYPLNTLLLSDLKNKTTGNYLFLFLFFYYGTYIISLYLSDYVKLPEISQQCILIILGFWVQGRVEFVLRPSLASEHSDNCPLEEKVSSCHADDGVQQSVPE